MTRINFLNAWMIAIITFTSTSAGAKPPRQPTPFGVDPYDWKCTYPYSETNCARVIKFWAEDNLDDPDDISDETVPCDGCEPIKIKDWNGDYWPMQYRCLQTLGYRISADDLNVKLSFYRKADATHGWEILDWVMYECVHTWHCYDMCAFDRGEPACLVTSVISVGLFQPVLGKPCDQLSAETAQAIDSPDLKEPSHGSK
ncbi:MAG: hypothetical protein AAGG48_08620 [Planctomycetota bacterium]